MKLRKILVAALAPLILLSGCGQTAGTETQDSSINDSQSSQAEESVVSTTLSQVDMTKWQY